ncbi:hypothetical protein BVX98_04260 [bacterium F11]|nr:hypothetical protein BVX98_04260 [bacterium F11]
MSIPKNPKEFLLDYFSQFGSIPGNSENEKLACDYIMTGLIDSFGVVELITKIESEFEFRLDNEDLENPKFKTIGGLLEILESKLKKV